jgi:hypothetical protein
VFPTKATPSPPVRPRPSPPPPHVAPSSQLEHTPNPADVTRARPDHLIASSRLTPYNSVDEMFFALLFLVKCGGGAVLNYGYIPATRGPVEPARLASEGVPDGDPLSRRFPQVLSATHFDKLVSVRTGRPQQKETQPCVATVPIDWIRNASSVMASTFICMLPPAQNESVVFKRGVLTAVDAAVILQWQ